MTGSGKGILKDSFGRVMRDLRVSITDRCNFRCMYCLPETEEAAQFYQTRFAELHRHPNPKEVRQYTWLARSQILSFEEIERLVRISVDAGIEKVRITGGEPLLRQDVEKLVARIAAIPGIKDLALTTNGFLFLRKAEALRAAGLKRVSFSMDSLDQARFKLMTGRDGLGEVLESIKKAKELGFSPLKVNAVIIRGMNDDEVEKLADFAMGEGLTIRFIEFMPLDSGRSWLKELVVPGREILQRLKARFDLHPLQPGHQAETAKRWRIGHSEAEVGIIAPVSEPFCGHCNRLRITADGKLRTCLFSIGEHDLKPSLRNGATDDNIRDELVKLVLGKEERHHIGEPEFIQPQRTMSCIGG